MTKPHSINLKNIIIRWFLLYSLLFTTENIATSSDDVAVHNNTAMNSNNIATNHDRNVEPIYIITDSNENIANTTTKKYIACRNINTLRAISRRLNVYGDLEIFRNVYGLLFIADSTRISLYNYFTEHNKIENGWYRSKFFVFFGRKTNITKNFHLDLYFSFFNFWVNLLECIYITRDLLFLILKTISCDINIRIYKNFFFCLKPMSLIHICSFHIKRSLVRSVTTKYLLSQFTRDLLPQNFNFDNIRCEYTDPQEHTRLFNINTDNII